VFVFARTLGDRRAVVALNLRGAPVARPECCPNGPASIANYGLDRTGDLSPYEARIWTR
jgi:hypothetical protein